MGINCCHPAADRPAEFHRIFEIHTLRNFGHSKHIPPWTINEFPFINILNFLTADVNMGDENEYSA